MMISCTYGGFEFNCTEIFITVLTDEGLCCVFNGVHKKFIAKSEYKSVIFKSLSKNMMVELLFSISLSTFF